MKELSKTYDPKQVESKIYDLWMQGGYFEGKIDPDKEPFSIVMPPPNVTGQLHMGHALDATLQDILTRYKRMQGYPTLWLPGVDHAGIATQIKVEEVLRREEGKSRYDLGRDKFLERVWDWKQQYGDRIVEQQKTMGSSCDWSRSRFTMDEVCARSVRETFCDLYEKGLIYKGSRIINWCPKCRTALSDAEVEYKDIPGSFWYIRYPVEDSDEEFIIATTRPETMLGDTGVAVNPADERYQHLVGKNAILPLVGRKLPIVADDYVELGFGTGAVKMTPCHDPNDYEVGLRHGLEQVQCIDEDARIINGGKYDGMDRYECRKAIVADLEEQGYLVKVEPYSHNVGCCYRCGTTVEPLTSPQWFVKMKPLAKAAIDVVKDGRMSSKTGASSSCPSALPRPISTGWRTCTTGAFPASSGGAIRSRPGTATTAATSRSGARTPANARPVTARTSAATRTCSTPGSPPRSGPSPRWAGPSRRKTSNTGIPRPSWSRATTSSSSGSRA